jgi:hypothetical protein
LRPTLRRTAGVVLYLLKAAAHLISFSLLVVVFFLFKF